MERTRVSSSNIRSIGYDPQMEILEVEFLSGSIYQYSGMPEHISERLMAASSKGRLFDTHIRDKYQTRKIR